MIGQSNITSANLQILLHPLYVTYVILQAISLPTARSVTTVEVKDGRMAEAVAAREVAEAMVAKEKAEAVEETAKVDGSLWGEKVIILLITAHVHVIYVDSLVI